MKHPYLTPENTQKLLEYLEYEIKDSLKAELLEAAFALQDVKGKLTSLLTESTQGEAISLLEEKDREAIEFAEWLRINEWFPCFQEKGWIKRLFVSNQYKSTQELLTIYRQSKQTINK